ncbi:9866_t:CDS:2 [Dentiscutata erythropus]|uniref:9866_t:CDS:1 n=1 Tax=Dentiscutata erythropus TaxID=1348616 RepID=A0A9N8ZWB3_9GLOM|nr:9866_t:CDS:2 [Dentiscutata erythropus]
MIQYLPNELHIQILIYVANETNFEKFCSLRTVCKKWNSFVPLVTHEIVISRLNSGLKLELTDWNETKWSKNLPPTYCDSTKTFTFLFDNTDGTINSCNGYKKSVKNKINFIAYVEKSEDISIPIKLGAKFGELTFPDFINDDIYEYQFDHQNNVCFKRETNVDEKGESTSNIRIYSFTIAAWKLCYILDCLKFDRKLTNLKEGFQYHYERIRYFGCCLRSRIYATYEDDSSED